jgi:signal transduction histidine kinase
MSRPTSRTVIAAVLVAAGVIVPCTAWYIVGSRAADQQAARLAAAPMEQAGLEANHLAEQVSLRLEALLLSESRRPFEEYQSDDRYLQDDCAMELALRSPLTEGPVDSLIWTHFQINEVGEITLPTLDHLSNERGSDEALDPALAIQRAILDDLECADTGHAAALRRLPQGLDERPAALRDGVITVGSFTWHTASVKDQPALVAVRQVATPAAVLTQGFVVLSESLESLLAGSLFPSIIRPGYPGAETESAVTIHGDAWTIAVDPSQAAATAAGEAKRLRSRFRRTFWAGSMTALLAGCAVILLVWQTDRMARERARFAAAAAHELRTPLAGLQLYGEMLAEEEEDPSKIRLYARRVADEAERLGRVVTNVLKFSRLQRGGLDVKPVEGNLAAAVRESSERLRPALEARGAELELSIEEELPSVRFDPDALHQILQNLLDNAEKFSREASDRKIRVVVSAHDGRPTVSVIDRGAGMAASSGRGVLRRLSRRSGDGAPAGLGIGLTLVRELARAHDADLLHEEVSGGGSSFSVRFKSAA